MPGDSIQIGPFVGGLNSFSDPTAVADNQLVRAENLELDLDGSLVSRPPITDLSVPLPLGATGNMTLLGYYNAPGSVPYLIASDGLNSTYYYTGTTWSLLTNTIAASALEQFDNKAWLLAPVGSTNPGGYWTPGGGFVADANMPKGEVIVAHKFRLWVAVGKGAATNGTRMYVSKVLGTTPFWPTVPDFIDVGAGDGQNIVQIKVYYSSLLIFRTSSVYSFQFTSDPSQGATSLVLPGIGLSDKDAVVAFENYLYFMYDDRAYEFVNSRANQINVSVPLRAGNRSGIYKPYAASIFGSRVIFSYYDTMYVFSLRTRTWTTWISPLRGPIGKLLSQNSDTAMEQVIAHSSRQVAAGTTRTNLVFNPILGVDAAGWTSAFPAGQAGTLARVQLNMTWAWWAQLTFTTASAGSGAAVIYSTSTTAVTPGETYFARIFGWVNWAGAQTRAVIYWYNAASGLLGSSPGAMSVHASGVAEWRTSFGTAPAGAAFVRIDFQHSGGVGPSVSGAPKMAATAGFLIVNNANTSYFDGSSTTTSDYTYAWTGTANASASVETSRRYAPTYQITDGLTSDGEEFVCSMMTKNYNYEASSAYKRLFWWGVDAIFRGQVTATVIPVSFNYAVTWSVLSTYTWDSRRDFTWDQPVSGTLSVETVRDTAGSGSMRKFTKFNKSLRFRQAQFKLVFDTDGSISSAPVRIFSIMTYIKAKERVSKVVT